MRNRVPLVDLKAQYAAIRAEVHSAIDRVLESQQFILGREVEALEREIAAYCGTRFAIGVSSGTDALLVSLMALGVGSGDEVVTTPYSFIATASSVVRLGATPIFVDIEPDTFNIDASQLEEKITARTKAIVPVHLFGQMADMKAIAEIANRRGIPVVEDAAQAIGAQRDGQRAGSVGTLGCLSFFPTKNLGAYGDGGLVLTSDEQIADRVRRLRNHGQRSRHVADDLGGNFRLDEIQAAVLRAKLPFLEGWIAARRCHAEEYRRLFRRGRVADAPTCEEQGLLGMPREMASSLHTYSSFVVRARSRDALRIFLAKQGIGSQVYYPLPLHRQPSLLSNQRAPRFPEGELPRAERAALEALALPMYPELTLSMQQTVVDAVTDFIG